MGDAIGDRMKRYEKASAIYLTRRMPVIIRLDGKAFHTFTKSFQKPFDKSLMYIMEKSAMYVVDGMQGFKVAYIQSDEASFLITDYDDLFTDGWFDYKLQKMASVSASYMTSKFTQMIILRLCKNMICTRNTSVSDLIEAITNIKLAEFDSRAFNVPREDVANYFLWRAKDWHRNSIQMYARSMFSHSELINKNQQNIHDMLHSRGKNWATDLSNREKNGSWLFRTTRGIIASNDIVDNFDSIYTIIKPYIKEIK